MSRELHIVGFQVGRETYGVPITSLHEIVRVPEITAVPDAPEYMEGVINLIVLLDMTRLLDLGMTQKAAAEGRSAASTETRRAAAGK